MTLVDEAALQTSLWLVIQILKLAALQTVDAVVRTREHRLDADEFPMFSGGWLNLARSFVAIWICLLV